MAQSGPRSLSAEWPYWVGGVGIALVNVGVLLVLDRPWGVTGPITNLGARLLQQTGLQPEQWAYFRSPDIEQTFRDFDLWNGMLWLNLGLVAGVLLSSWAAGEFRLRPGRLTARNIGLGLLGGALMGYGTRLTLGCNAGALLGGIASLSLHGWVFAALTFLGLWLGSRVFRRLL